MLGLAARLVFAKVTKRGKPSHYIAANWRAAVHKYYAERYDF